MVVQSQEVARKYNHDYIGTEHLLMGLIREGEGVAAKALVALGLDDDVLTAAFEEVVKGGDGSRKGHIPFTPRAKKVLEYALREALQLGHNYIGTEHVLLGLIHDGDDHSAALLMLRYANVETPQIRKKVVELLSGYTQPGQTEKQGRATDMPLVAVLEVMRVSSDLSRIAQNSLAYFKPPNRHEIKQAIGDLVNLLPDD